jgi:NTP pyrophosphatase (non-canonical NTP hydrolase)
MNIKIKEALALLQEECAEVIVEVSKCNRFGLDSVHYKTNLTHSTMLETEVGDVLCLVDFLIEKGLLDTDRLNKAKEAKKEKLKKWSTIYEVESK